MKTYTSILFDLDGTLTDSGPGITKGVQYALSKFNITVADITSLQKFIGPPLTDSFMGFYNLTKENADKALEYYREYYSETGIYENELYSGIDGLLLELCESNLDLYIATSKPTAYAKRVCEYFDIERYFIDIQGSDIREKLSNKTDVIKKVIDTHQVMKTRTIMVGDREHDVIGSSANGIECVGVGYGYGSKEELLNSGATYFANDITELRNILVRSC